MNESNLMKALVVEDEWPTRNYLVKLIQGTELAEVIGAVATIDEAREALTGSPIDVVFVDLHLAGTGDARTGLDLIRSIADSPGAPMFVIATAFEEHSLEAYKLGVVDYLLKPFTEDRVEQCLRRLAARRPERHSGPLRVVARRKRNLIFLDPREIWAFEAFGRALTRIHRNWLVNLDYVKEMEREGGDVVLFIGTEVGSEGIHAPVSRDRAKVVRDLLLENATGLRRH